MTAINAAAKPAKKNAAAAKPARSAKAEKPAAKPAFNAAAAQEAIAKAMQARIAYASEKGIANQVKNLEAEAKFFASANFAAALAKLNEYGFDALPFAAMLANTEDKVQAKQIAKSDYVAVYALQKVRKGIFAIAQGLRSSFDGYSVSIIHNLNKLQTLSNINTQRSICKAIEFDEIEQQVALRRLHECSPSTASTQASSTREMLRFLNVCAVRKGSKGDSISFNDNDIAKRVQQIFADA